MPRERNLAREPCPNRIVDDIGGAFGTGFLGGTIWHFIKGARNSPRGEILGGAIYSAKMRAPILGGSFAVWGGTFSSFDCTFQHFRGTDDAWNSIASGFCTGGVLAMRGGWRSAAIHAMTGGVLLSIIEAVSAVLARTATPTPRQQFKQQMEYEKFMKGNNNSSIGNSNSGFSSDPQMGSGFGNHQN